MPASNKKKIGGLTRDAKTKLQSYAWPGNVRELQHAIERAVILSDGPMLRPENFMLHPAPSPKERGPEELNLGVLEKEAIERALRRRTEYHACCRAAGNHPFCLVPEIG